MRSLNSTWFSTAGMLVLGAIAILLLTTGCGNDVLETIDPETISRGQLAAMVLPVETVQQMYPDMALDIERSGYTDNRRAQLSRIQPDASPRAEGRIGGYHHEFLDVDALSGSISATRPYLALSMVDLYLTSDEAFASVWRFEAEIDRFYGRESRGIHLTEVVHSPLPGFGQRSAAGRIGQLDLTNDVESTIFFVMWARGPVMGRIVLVTMGSEGLSTTAKRFAMLMDERIQDILVGDESLTSGNNDPQTSTEGCDLTALMLDGSGVRYYVGSNDGPFVREGLTTEVPGYGRHGWPVGTGETGHLRPLWSADVDVPGYYRTLYVTGPYTMHIGQTGVDSISGTAFLFPSVEGARRSVEFFEGRSPGFFREFGLTPWDIAIIYWERTYETATVNELELDTGLGEVSLAQYVSVDTSELEVNVVVALFSVGRVSVRLIVEGTHGGPALGPASDIGMNDVLRIGGVIAEKIVQHCA